MITIGYDFAGSLVTASADARAHFAGLDVFLESLETEHRADPAFRIVVKVGELPAPPDDARILHTGPVWDEPDAIYAVADGTRIFHLPGKASLTISPVERTGTIFVTPDTVRCVGGLCGMHAIDAAVEATGQILLHGAALTLPDRSAGVVLHAASGTGKTTTTLRLAFDGMGVFTDDAAVIRSAAAGHEVWGLPRDLKIHKTTAALDPRFHGLASGSWDCNGEQPVRRDTLITSGVRVEPAHPVPLRAFVHLLRNAETMSGPTTVRPISKTEALYALVQDNVRGADKGLPDFQRDRMTRISATIRDVATLECRIGNDYDRITQRLLEALEIC